MNARRRRLKAGAVVISLLLRIVPAAGDTAPPSVDIFVAGSLDEVARLEGAIGVADRPIRWVPIGRVDVEEVMRRPAEVAPQAARAWIDCSSLDRMRIYFANWNSERFLVREVPLPAGLNELALESVGQVIASSLSALMTDENAGLSRAEMTSVIERTRSAPEPPRSRTAWGATWGAFYAVQAFAPEQWVEQGPGLMAKVGQREGSWRTAGWVSGQYQLPETVDTGLIGVRLDTVALRAGAEVSRALSPRLGLALRGGLGGDVIHIAPRRGSAAKTSLQPERFTWGYAAQVALACTVRLDAGFALSVALIADADLDMRHYDVAVDGLTIRALTPWWVRPGLMAGVTWP
ncbi:MAG TPA: hypothetical protein VN894_09665 [Polyangiaceae bacterium]|nr:hypothetical protein [Polyangiaceae bacterium]